MKKRPVISAIVLAAGESKRMGAQKLLLPLDNGTILERTAANYVNSKVDETIIILGYKSDELINILTGKKVKTVINPAYHRGMSTSIAAGIKTVDPRARGIMIGMADEPFIDSQTIDILLDEFLKKEKGIVVPLYRGIRGHPVIFDVKYKEALMKLKGDTGGRQIISQNPDDVLEVKVECEGINRDIDTWDAYRLYSDESELKSRRATGR